MNTTTIPPVQVRWIIICPHCTLSVRECEHCARLGDPMCQGYVHDYNGQHACNPVNPVYVAERPVRVSK